MPKKESYYSTSTSGNVVKAKSADAAAKKAWRSAKKKGGVTIEKVGGGGSDDDGPLEYHVQPGTNPFGTKKPHTMKGERKERGNKRFNGMNGGLD